MPVYYVLLNEGMFNTVKTCLTECPTGLWISQLQTHCKCRDFIL